MVDDRHLAPDAALAAMSDFLGADGTVRSA